MKFLKNLLLNINSRLSMKPIDIEFIDNGGWKLSCKYIDKYGKIWLAPYPFYVWSDRIEQIKQLPCYFDHNGDCLVCDCWSSECAWQRYLREDYRWESKEELEEMFKDNVSYE